MYWQNIGTILKLLVFIAQINLSYTVNIDIFALLNYRASSPK